MVEKNEDEVRMTLRLPSDLHRHLVALAARERRSLHAQIVYLLERVVEDTEVEGKAAA